uniref:NAC domain-containing protein n=1 Tax=Oryza punctata TaxID=4537 RepID=A0A0E0JMD6_ORYPU
MVDACPPVLASSWHPSELELITSYLQPRVSSSANKAACHHRFIYNVDVYSDDPARLTTKFRPALSGDREKVLFFFSPARTKTSRGHRRARTVVDTGEGAGAPKLASRPFSTPAGNVLDTRSRTGWLMVELGLDREQQQENLTDDDSPLVLCKIYFTPRTPAGGRMPLDLAGLKRNAAGELVGPSTPPAGQRRPSLSGSTENDSTQAGSSGSKEASDGSSGPKEASETKSITERADASTAASTENSIAERSDGTTTISTELPQQQPIVPVVKACRDRDTMDVDCPTRVEAHHNIVDDDDDHDHARVGHTSTPCLKIHNPRPAQPIVLGRTTTQPWPVQAAAHRSTTTTHWVWVTTDQTSSRSRCKRRAFSEARRRRRATCPGIA